MTYISISELDLENKFRVYLDSIKSPLMLYKGIASNSELNDILFIDPTTIIRPSKTLFENGNAYNLLLNNLNCWSTYPKRQNSVIGSTNIMTARKFGKPHNGLAFGKTYVILPKPDARIAIAPKNDIWYSFQAGLGRFGLRGNSVDLILFNTCLSEIFKSKNYTERVSFNWDEFIGAVIDISTSDNKLLGLSTESTFLLLKLKLANANVMEFIENSFDPNLNGFILSNYHKLLNEFNNNEIWTDSPCILIEENLFFEEYYT